MRVGYEDDDPGVIVDVYSHWKVTQGRSLLETLLRELIFYLFFNVGSDRFSVKYHFRADDGIIPLFSGYF